MKEQTFVVGYSCKIYSHPWEQSNSKRKMLYQHSLLFFQQGTLQYKVSSSSWVGFWPKLTRTMTSLSYEKKSFEGNFAEKKVSSYLILRDQLSISQYNRPLLGRLIAVGQFLKARCRASACNVMAQNRASENSTKREKQQPIIFRPFILLRAEIYQVFVIVEVFDV